MYDDTNINYEVSGIQKSSVILFSMEKQIFSNKNYKIFTIFLFLICYRYILNLWIFIDIFNDFLKKNVSFLKIYTN